MQIFIATHIRYIFIRRDVNVLLDIRDDFVQLLLDALLLNFLANIFRGAWLKINKEKIVSEREVHSIFFRCCTL